MEQMKFPDLPDGHKKFISAVIAAAQANGMDRFTLKYRPGFETPTPDDIGGDIEINYRGIDGRGRPEFSVRAELSVRFPVEFDGI